MRGEGEGVGDVGGQGVEVAEVGDEAVDLFNAEARGGVADLAVQVGELDDVVVDDADGADAGAGDVLRGGAAEAAGTDDEDAAVDEADLG